MIGNNNDTLNIPQMPPLVYTREGTCGDGAPVGGGLGGVFDAELLQLLRGEQPFVNGGQNLRHSLALLRVRLIASGLGLFLRQPDVLADTRNLVVGDLEAVVSGDDLPHDAVVGQVALRGLCLEQVKHLLGERRGDALLLAVGHLDRDEFLRRAVSASDRGAANRTYLWSGALELFCNCHLSHYLFHYVLRRFGRAASYTQIIHHRGSSVKHFHASFARVFNTRFCRQRETTQPTVARLPLDTAHPTDYTEGWKTMRFSQVFGSAHDMPDFEAMVILDVKLSAPTEAAARAFIKEALENRANPFTLSNQPDIRLRRIIPDDGRMVSHIPNLPREQVITRMGKLSETQLCIYAYCAKPRTLHAITQHVMRQHAQAQTSDVVRDVAALKRDDWLAKPNNRIDIDTFPTPDTRAQFSALAGN